MTAIARLTVLLGLGLLTACNTIEGAGRDISSGGKAISETANEVKKKLP